MESRERKEVIECIKFAVTIGFAIVAAIGCVSVVEKTIERDEVEKTIEVVDMTTEIVPHVEELAEDDLEETMYYDSLELLALLVEAEAGNQDLEGKRLVVDVVLNRVDDPDFPNDIWGVITDKNAFSSYWDGGIDKVWSPAESSYEAVRLELEERSYPGVLYFTSEGYSKYGTPWRKVGDHYFSTK